MGSRSMGSRAGGVFIIPWSDDSWIFPSWGLGASASNQYAGLVFLLNFSDTTRLELGGGAYVLRRC
jgi:hypothetical protein